MRLYLVRHGIAVEGLRGGITKDSERPLTDEGRDEMKQVAKALKKIGVKPDLILSSPLVRARQTAEYISEALDQEIKITDALAPAVNFTQLFRVIGRHETAKEVFLVGHEPDMGMLVGNLLYAGPGFEMPFKKAGVCRIDVTGMPPDGLGVLKWYLTPKIVKGLLD